MSGNGWQTGMTVTTMPVLHLLIQKVRIQVLPECCVAARGYDNEYYLRASNRDWDDPTVIHATSVFVVPAHHSPEILVSGILKN